VNPKQLWKKLKARARYRYHAVERDTRGDVPVWRVTDWEPYEVSAVSVPADFGSQFRGGTKFEFEVRG
jgi:hypothetical protein